MKYILKGRFLALSLVLLLLFCSLAFSESEEARETRATDPDLSVEDIWFNSTSSRVWCRIVNLGIDYQGQFILNLTVDGYPYYQELVYWAPGQGVANVTFSQGLMWSTSRIKVEVEIYYHIIAVDANFSNNLRVEVWNRELPDLIVRSFYQDPEKENTVAVIENIGEVECTQFFYVILNIYGQSQPWEMVFDPIPPHGRIKVPFQWVWNRTLMPQAEISISVDFPNDVAEMNNSNNGYFITWTDRSSLYFLKGPICKDPGETKATIEWETSVPAVTFMEYGMTSKLGKSAETKTPKTSDSLEIGSLKPSTQYLYRIMAKDEFGRTVRSGLLSFVTDDPDGTADVAGGFERSSYSIKPEVVRIPFSISEKLGLRKVDLYLNGKMIKSNGAMGKGTFRDLTLDMSMKKAGSYALIARVETLTGEEKEFMTTLVVQARPTIRYPIVNFSPSPTLPRRGSEFFIARCEDPGGMVNASWYVNGALMEVDEARHPDASYFGPLFTLDTTSLSEGEATIGIEVRNHEGNVTSVERTILIDNILDPPDPDIWVRRGNILRTGTTCTVPLTVSNHGRGTAVDIVVEDWIRGFVPINGDPGTQTGDTLSIIWKVVLEVGSLEPEDEVTVTYDCIPIIYDDEEWELGAWRWDSTVGENFTTSATYLREDRLVDYSRYYGIPTANFDEGYIMRAGALHAISQSSYMVLTVPIRLASAIGWRESDQLLMRTAYLASLKWGVFGFPPRRAGVAPSEEQILDDLIEWKDMMAPLFDDMGYLMILGEDVVIPAWNYNSVYWDGSAWNDVGVSDHGYSNLNGGNAPELIVGRIIGDDLGEMLRPINTSIHVHEGGLYNDHEGKALLLSGAGSGVQQFQNNMDDLAALIAPTMADLDVVHKSDAFPIIENDFIENDGITGHMAAGDVDGDNLGEVVILNTAADRVRIFNPDYGGSESFDLVMTE
ncbi:MAG: C25 family cysteine peptidase, partial [Thermoplasmatota archaeon]